MTTLLALETSSEACSVALHVRGELIERHEVIGRRHNELIFTFIDDVLARAGVSRQQLDVLAFGRGPGSFTGIRIAAGIVQGIGSALDIPVVAVSSLEAMALTALQQHPAQQVLLALDARMQEIYFACYGNEPFTCLVPEQVVAPEAVDFTALGSQQQTLLVGDGWQLPALSQWRQARQLNEAIRVNPSAAQIAALALPAYQRGEAVPAELAQPVYLRESIGWKKLPGRGTD